MHFVTSFFIITSFITFAAHTFCSENEKDQKWNALFSDKADNVISDVQVSTSPSLKLPHESNEDHRKKSPLLFDEDDNEPVNFKTQLAMAFYHDLCDDNFIVVEVPIVEISVEPVQPVKVSTRKNIDKKKNKPDCLIS